MAKQLQFSDDARQALARGVNTLAKAVTTTLGPRGRNVALEKKWGAPAVLHDGVSVAKEIELEDPFENMGVQLAKEAASRTGETAGDGTTTSTLLMQSLVNLGMKNITAGHNPMILKKGIEKAVEVAVGEIKKASRDIPLDDEEAVAQVATISAANKEIGSLIASAFQKVGKDGVISVEEGSGLEMEILYKEGMEFDKGFASPYFAESKENMVATIDHAQVIVTDKKISSIQEMIPLMDKVVQTSKDIVIICDDIDNTALATLVVNKMKGILNILVVKAPAFGDRRKEMLEDIAVLTGATVISDALGMEFDSVEVDVVGRAHSVVSSKDHTRIIVNDTDQERLEQRVNQIKSEIASSKSEFDTAKLQERLAKLTGGVAVIQVGAVTEVELKEKKERVDDAVHATKAALAEGIVAGGGTTFLKARKALLALREAEMLEEERVGVDIVYQTLSEPVRMLARNSGMDAGLVLHKVESSKKKDFGFNAATLEFGSMLDMGVVDPTKVVRSALENAASTATMILTTEALVANKPQVKSSDKE